MEDIRLYSLTLQLLERDASKVKGAGYWSHFDRNFVTSIPQESREAYFLLKGNFEMIIIVL